MFAPPLRRSAAAPARSSLPAGLGRDIGAQRGRGRPLTEPARAFFEPRFGIDLGAVRIHADREAEALSASLGARAFTLGPQIFFGRGQLDEHSGDGRRLLAHELAHSVAQQQTGARAVQRAGDADKLQSPRFAGDVLLEQILGGTAEMSTTDNAKDPAVKKIQQALIDGGYLAAKPGATGEFDAATQSAVQIFQLTAGLDTGLNLGSKLADGIVRSLTMKRLDQMFPAGAKAAGTAPPKPSDFRVLHLGRDEDMFVGLEFRTFYFDFDSSKLAKRETERMMVLSDPEAKKKDTIGMAVHDDDEIELIASASEEGAPAYNKALAKRRGEAVGKALRDLGHKGSQDVIAQPEQGLNQLDYRRQRRVDVMPKGTAAAMSTSSGGSGGSAKVNDCKKPVEDALPKAVELLDKTRKRLEKNDPKEKAVIDEALRPFRGASVIPKLLPKLKSLQEHLETNVKTKFACSPESDPTCGRMTMAYNMGDGAGAMMNVCQKFTDEKDLVTRADFLIHEATHGTTDIQSSDFARRFHRAFLALDQDSALRNADSYSLVARRLGADDTSVQMGRNSMKADKLSGFKDDENAKATHAIAFVETWLDVSQSNTSGVYKKVIDARAEKKWTPTPYMYMMNLLAPRFGLSRPPVVPTERDQTAVAAIHDRYRSMMERVTGNSASPNLTLARGSGSTDAWGKGDPDTPLPGATVTLADGFFGVTSPVDRVRFLLRLLVDATPDISAELRPTYVDVADLMRQTNGHPEP